jgi:hypothetical protein
MVSPGKNMDTELPKFSVRIDPALIRAVKISAITNGRSIQAEMDAVLRSYFGIPIRVQASANGKAKAARKPSGVAKARPAAREAITA